MRRDCDPDRQAAFLPGTGGNLRTGYLPGEVTFSLGSLLALFNPRRGQTMEEPSALLEKVTQVDSKFLCPI